MSFPCKNEMNIRNFINIKQPRFEWIYHLNNDVIMKLAILSQPINYRMCKIIP